MFCGGVLIPDFKFSNVSQFFPPFFWWLVFPSYKELLLCRLLV